MTLSHYTTNHLWGSPARFNLSANMPYIHHFVEWITFDNNNFAGQHNNYFAYFYLFTFPANNTIKINFTIISYPEIPTGVSITLLLVAKKTSTRITAQYSTFTYDGFEFNANRQFQYNFGIPTA